MLFLALTVCAVACGVAVKVWQHLPALSVLGSIVKVWGEVLPWLWSPS